MAHFYATVSSGNGRKVTTKTGTKNTGIAAHIRGWSLGVRVEMVHDERTGKDEIMVYATSGSNGGPETLIGTFSEGENPSEKVPFLKAV